MVPGAIQTDRPMFKFQVQNWKVMRRSVAHNNNTNKNISANAISLLSIDFIDKTIRT